MPDEIRRITIPLPVDVYEYLEGRAESEGRKPSNLAAFLLTKTIREEQEKQKPRPPNPGSSSNPSATREQSNNPGSNSNWEFNLPSIADLLKAHIFIKYKGLSQQSLTRFAKDCDVPIESVLDGLQGRQVEEEVAGVFAAKLKLKFEEFQALQPKVNNHESTISH